MRLLAVRRGLWAALLGLPGLRPALAGDEEVFQVHAMLRSAAEAAAVGADARRQAATAITAACVSEGVAAVWRASFEDAVQSMLQKTRRTMQKGLSGVARSVVELVEGSSCGDIAVLERFKEQAARLRVLATSHGGLASLDSKVKYEPLKALSVGDIDIHGSLNGLIVAWQLQKGTQEVGEALMRFLGQFSDDPEESQPPQAAPAETAVTGSAPADTQGVRTPSFFAEVFNEAFHRLGDTSRTVSADCFSHGATENYGKLLDSSFQRMMQKTRRGMQLGLKGLAADTLALLDTVEAACPGLKQSNGAKRLRSGASRLAVLSAVKTLMQHGAHVEYEAMKVLKIGGIDVHLEVNRFIGHWMNFHAATDLGDALADFFEDFKEEEEPEESSSAADPSHPLFAMIWAAIEAGSDEKPEFLPSCFGRAATEVFARELDAAIDHMLKKRKRTMQQGLKELADATDRLLAGEQAECVRSPGAKLIWRAAKKLRRLTRRTVVDYGTHIQYEAMQSLTVGGVTVHSELNQFLATWKLRSQAESGAPFGELMRKLSAIEGSDEL